MSRTSKNKKRRALPRPGAAKLNIAVDNEIGKNSDGLSRKLISEFLRGNPTAMNIVVRWSEDAEFAEECVKVHGKTLNQFLNEIEAEVAQPPAEVGAETTTGAREPQS